MAKTQCNRRAFVSSTLTALIAMSPSNDGVGLQTTEAGVYRVELPPKTKLWGVIAFLGEEMSEVTVASPRKPQTQRGRFDGKKLVEFSCANDANEVIHVAISARALNTQRDLSVTNARYVADQHLFIGFGHRPQPPDRQRRHGGYPHEAVLVGFILFGDE